MAKRLFQPLPLINRWRPSQPEPVCFGVATTEASSPWASISSQPPMCRRARRTWCESRRRINFAGGHNLALRGGMERFVSRAASCPRQTNPPVARPILSRWLRTGFPALKADGTVVGWGGNGSGQITIPAAASNVVAVAAGNAHSLALCRDGSIVSWGNNVRAAQSASGGFQFNQRFDRQAINIAAVCWVMALRCSTRCAGRSVVYSNPGLHFECARRRAPPLSYQWRFNGVDLPAPPAGLFTLASVQPRMPVLLRSRQQCSGGEHWTGRKSRSRSRRNCLRWVAAAKPDGVGGHQNHLQHCGRWLSCAHVSVAIQQRQSGQRTNAVMHDSLCPHESGWQLSRGLEQQRRRLHQSGGYVDGDLPDWPAINSGPRIARCPMAVHDARGSGRAERRGRWFTRQRNGTTLPQGGPTLVFSAFTRRTAAYRVAVSKPVWRHSQSLNLKSPPCRGGMGQQFRSRSCRCLDQYHRLEAGAQHAVALKADGRVAAGENSVVAGSYPLHHE